MAKLKHTKPFIHNLSLAKHYLRWWRAKGVMCSFQASFLSQEQRRFLSRSPVLWATCMSVAWSIGMWRQRMCSSPVRTRLWWGTLGLPLGLRRWSSIWPHSVVHHLMQLQSCSRWSQNFSSNQMTISGHSIDRLAEHCSMDWQVCAQNGLTMKLFNRQ